MASVCSDVTLVMPVSGNKFINEAWLAAEVVRCGCQIGRILSTSGGTIVAMMMLAAKVGWVHDEPSYIAFHERYRFIIGELDHTWYARKRSESPMLNTILFFKHGSLFERGNGEEQIKKYDLTTDGQPEVWMGTQNATTFAHQIWCTKSEQECSVKLRGAKYLAGDIPRITKAAIGSCDVPTLVNSIEIDGEFYRDGGMRFASPLGDCLPIFNTAVTRGALPYKIIYISPIKYNCAEDGIVGGGGMQNDDAMDRMKMNIAGMITDTHIIDRDNGIRALGTHGAVTTYGFGDIALCEALRIQANARMSFINLTPLNPVFVNFLLMPKGYALEKYDHLCATLYHVRHDYVL